MKVTRKLKMNNWDVYYRINWNVEECRDPHIPKDEPIRAISQDMYDWKKEMIPWVWLFDVIVKRLLVSSSEIIDVQND